VRALITGITGQDGSYLAEYLLELGYDVHGTVRTATASALDSPIGHLLRGDDPPVRLHVTDLGDSHSLSRMIDEVRPTEVYNLAAQSHVSASFDQPVNTGSVTGLGTVRILEAIRHVDPTIHFYQASSSEMFGAAPPPQSEATPFHPRSPYAVAKLYAHWATVNYREAHGIHASSGILFNHESPRRGRSFVTRKITSSIPRILSGELSRIRLGNLGVRRDWGHARDYVVAMHRMVHHPDPLTLVVGSGVSHSVEEFLATAFDVVGLDWHDYVEIDKELYRPAEVDHVCADPSLAREKIGWEATTSFRDLIAEMVQADLAAVGLDI